MAKKFFQDSDKENKSRKIGKTGKIIGSNGNKIFEHQNVLSALIRVIFKNFINKLTVVCLSKAQNRSSWAIADFSKASCFLIKFSTSSIVCYDQKLHVIK